MASLLLGPILRHIGEIDATVWVEADSACDVEILGRRERTFRVNDRDYAIPTIERLEPSRAARTSTKLFQGALVSTRTASTPPRKRGPNARTSPWRRTRTQPVEPRGGLSMLLA